MAASESPSPFTVVKLSRASQYHIDHLVGGSKYNQTVEVSAHDKLRNASSEKTPVPAATFSCFGLLPLELRRRIWKYYIRDQARIIEIIGGPDIYGAGGGRVYALPDILCINKETRIDALKVHGYSVFQGLPATRFISIDPEAHPHMDVYHRPKTDMLFFNSIPQESWTKLLRQPTQEVGGSMRCIALHYKMFEERYKMFGERSTLECLKMLKALELIFVVLRPHRKKVIANLTFELAIRLREYSERLKKEKEKSTFEEASRLDEVYVWACPLSGLLLKGAEGRVIIQTALAREENGVLVVPQVRFVRRVRVVMDNDY